MKNFLTFFTILAMTAIGYYATGYIIAQGTTRDRAATDHTGRYAKDGISSESIDTTSPHRLDTPTSGQHRRERIIELENGNIAVTAKILELLKIPLFDHSGKFRTDQLEQLGFTPAQVQYAQNARDANLHDLKKHITNLVTSASLPDNEPLHIEGNDETAAALRQKFIDHLTKELPGPLGGWLINRTTEEATKVNGEFGAHPMRATRTTAPDGVQTMTLEFLQSETSSGSTEPSNPAVPHHSFRTNPKIQWKLE